MLGVNKLRPVILCVCVAIFLIYSKVVLAKYSNGVKSNLTIGIARIMQHYDFKTGLWSDPNCVATKMCNEQTGWWYWANVTRLLADYESITRSTIYNKYLRNTYLKNKMHMTGRRFFDDEGWWGLALIAMYRGTRDINYLRTAQTISDDIYKRGKQEVCGGSGGIYWGQDKTQVASIANGLFLDLNAKLYLITKKKEYLNRAINTWQWFKQSGLMDDDLKIYDHYNIDGGKCGQKFTWLFTYIYGVMASGLIDLAKATHKPEYVNISKKMAQKGMETFSVNGILTESCSNVLDCADDMFLFKGLFAYDLAYIATSTSDNQFFKQVKQYLTNNYLKLLATHNDLKDKISSDSYAFIWSKPPNLDKNNKSYNPTDIVTQIAALYLFNANLLIDNSSNLVSENAKSYGKNLERNRYHNKHSHSTRLRRKKR